MTKFLNATAALLALFLAGEAAAGAGDNAAFEAMVAGNPILKSAYAPLREAWADAPASVKLDLKLDYQAWLFDNIFAEAEYLRNLGFNREESYVFASLITYNSFLERLPPSLASQFEPLDPDLFLAALGHGELAAAQGAEPLQAAQARAQLPIPSPSRDAPWGERDPELERKRKLFPFLASFSAADDARLLWALFVISITVLYTMLRLDSNLTKPPSEEDKA
ncbi:MAG: hypothetical protein LBO66_05215 [Deltaproteobacteria bacterium]|nr:hypothetical protein [Deltaproteobacteria bacterium]